jgi:hypothetical protein
MLTLFVLATGHDVYGDHACAFEPGLRAWCWGANGLAELGFAAPDPQPTPTMPGIPPPDAIAVGARHACALTAGTVRCIGDGTSGQLGPPGGFPGAILVSAGSDHTCAGTATGVSCWGSNVSGQLGDGTVVSRNVPMPVVGLPALRPISLDAGHLHTCAVLAGGDAWCWGTAAAIDPPSGTAPLAPRLLFRGASAITTGGSGGGLTCALVAGEVWCIGTVTSELGYGTGATPVVPVRVQLL